MAISDSFKTTGSASAMTSGGRAAYGARLMTRAPASRAARAAHARVSRSTSSEQSSTSPGPRRPAALERVGSASPLAPAMTMIEFSPCSSTVMRAVPVGAVRLVDRRCVDAESGCEAGAVGRAGLAAADAGQHLHVGAAGPCGRSRLVATLAAGENGHRLDRAPSRRAAGGARASRRRR